jgi:hypothetical protein
VIGVAGPQRVLLLSLILHQITVFRMRLRRTFLISSCPGERRSVAVASRVQQEPLPCHWGYWLRVTPHAERLDPADARRSANVEFSSCPRQRLHRHFSTTTIYGCRTTIVPNHPLPTFARGRPRSSLNGTTLATTKVPWHGRKTIESTEV